MSSETRKRRSFGFTLIEILVVLGVIGILLTLLMPAVQQTRAASRRIQCQNRLHQVGLALHIYHDAHRILPPGALVIGPIYSVTFSGWGWGAMVLPMVDQTPLHSRLNFSLGTAVGDNEPQLRQKVPLWNCPSDSGAETISVAVSIYPPTEIATGNYCGSTGLIGPLSAVRFAHVTDGLSQTLLIGERVNQPSTPSNPPYTAAWAGIVAKRDAYVFNSLPYTTANAAFSINAHLGGTQNFSSRHTGGAYFTFGDGAVKFLNENLDGNTFEALGTPAGGEIVEY